MVPGGRALRGADGGLRRAGPGRGRRQPPARERLRWSRRAASIRAAEPERLTVAEAFGRYAGIDLLATLSTSTASADRDGAGGRGGRSGHPRRGRRHLVRHLQPRAGRAGRAAARPRARDDPVRVSRWPRRRWPAPKPARSARGRALRALCLRRRARQRLRRADRPGRAARAASRPRWRRRSASTASAIRSTRTSSPRLALMPPASGIALGFDRLVMLATGARIEQVLWTPVPD